MTQKFVYPATLLCDFYKVSHKNQYPKGTELVYSTWTARTSRIEDINQVVAFGFQSFIKEYLINYFNDNFFARTKAEVANEYKRVIQYALGVEEPDATHIEALHDLGFLPIKIKAIKEGALVPIKVPMLTIENTKPEFFWLTNYLETLMSCQLWMPATSATLAFEYRKILEEFAVLTNGDTSMVPFQGHDFSMRGMSSLEAAKTSGAGHLISFTGTDTIPAILYLEDYYQANIENELVGTSIPATEHSVMCAHGTDEMASYKYLIKEVYPTGFVSIVSDTWDLWSVLDVVIRGLKEDILSRDGKVVIRPDSGDPVKIICGDLDSAHEFERKGVIEILWEVFGGTITDKGFKQLDSHIGAIYGDAITIGRCREICEKLAAKGFASTNMVYGIGSYTYQYNTRDTFGFALKSTFTIINGEERKIFKDPKTDSGHFKKSQTGLVLVTEKEGEIGYIDNLSVDEYEKNKSADLLEVVFVDGHLVRDHSLKEIRETLLENL
ncbi:nicotinate phosphoribosyltransferase [Paenibacillus radicis (ex Xue et al. 2023)]|uniref:Nicotinamide phosphoribosyltransferase n=1 Tax=Paenibacillus radicis (ex Xue et al. 2023) TaxID=2972489 RepID=A0ABT1YUI6_9BACL|nr:nicotinate phosphoribosyltransferase [Paenibacillus radicis (ex Xue et al. 2023)]MCR8636605.1 nicotinate phosphoribosyltransferase [Paenibacillus radicis (ex Xue et al. 2023)]